MAQSELQKRALALEAKRDAAERLNQAIEHAGYERHTRDILIANQTGVSRQTVAEWLVGVSTPCTTQHAKLANLLCVRREWLTSGIGEMLTAEQEQAMTGVAVLKSKEISAWLEAPAVIEQNTRMIAMLNPRKRLFAYVQTGDAMATANIHSIPKGAMLLIDSHKTEITHDTRYLVKFAGEEKPICLKALKTERGSVTFIAENPAISIHKLFDRNRDRILGAVKNVLL